MKDNILITEFWMPKQFGTRRLNTALTDDIGQPFVSPPVREIEFLHLQLEANDLDPAAYRRVREALANRNRQIAAHFKQCELDTIQQLDDKCGFTKLLERIHS